MPDGRRHNGGARTGAGRKAKAVEADFQKRLKRAIKGEEPQDLLDRAFKRLVQDVDNDSFRIRHGATKLLFAYGYGKPVQRVIVEEDQADDGRPRADLSQLNQEELDVLERAGEIIARARRGQGRKGQA
jgi:hypothetical protein